MATDIKISELNEITVNNDLNQIIINSRENSGDSGITKKIQVSNFLTPNIVKTGNITDCAVTTNKIDSKAVTFNKIADNTITSNQVTCCGISNGSLATNSVDNRTINNSDNFTFNCVTAATNVNTPLATVTNKLTVGALGCGKTVSLNGINYDFPATEVPNYFLQTDGSGNLSWAEAVPGDGTALVFSDIVPVGTIIPWAGAALPADGKWLECNGTTFDGTNYPELSAVLGDTWGTHSGSNYFLPNLQGRAAVGSGTGNDGTDSCTFTLGTSGGKYSHTLCLDQIPSHCHDVCGQVTDENGFGNFTRYSRSNSSVFNSKLTSEPVGGGQSHNNIQPYAVTRYIIKALPDDIQQFGMNVGPGLSALNASGGQTASIDLSSTEIGLKVTDDFQFDGSGRLTLNDSVSASSITFDDGSVQTGAGIGYGQTWKLGAANGNIGQTPAWGSYFTNTTGRPIALNVVTWRNANDGTQVSIEIDGFAMTIVAATNSGGGVLGSGSVIIPVGATYRFQSIDDSLTAFTVYELS
jgi:microcystin-dependent protein